MSPTESSYHVGVLAYDDCFATEVFGLIDLLAMANLVTERSRHGGVMFRTSVLGRRSSVVASGGHRLTSRPIDTPVDALVVPGFRLVGQRTVRATLEHLTPEIARIRDAFATGSSVASVCVGAFLLGEAGLLDDRRVTTAWLYADLLQAHYPKAKVHSDQMMVNDGAVTTTAAFSAVHDLALRFVREYSGDEIARRVARITLVADNRLSQAPYVDDRLLTIESDRLVRDVKRWLSLRLAEPYDLGRLAAEFHVSTRTMLRHFSREAGQSPLSFLQSARIETAKRLLESPGATVVGVMEQVGYRDITSFRRLFSRHAGISPGEYRATFRRGASSEEMRCAPPSQSSASDVIGSVHATD